MLGLDAPHTTWDEEEFARRLMPLRAWRLGAARLLAAQLASELAGGHANLHRIIATLAGDLAPFALLEEPKPPEGFERLAELDRLIDELMARIAPHVPRDPASRALRRALLSLDYLNPASRAARFPTRNALRALEELRELQLHAALRRAYAETRLELAKINAKRLELGMEPIPLPGECDPGECRYCPARALCSMTAGPS